MAIIAACDLALGGRTWSRVHAGALDEVAHAATGLLLWQADEARAHRVALAIGSLLPDVDHVPDALGVRWLRRGTARPITHSLAGFSAPVVLAGIACPRRHRGAVVRGLGGGLALHLLRDLATPRGYRGLMLAWPSSTRETRVPYPVYAAVMIALSARAPAV